MKLAIASIAMPIPIRAIATSQTKIFGYRMIAIPRAMNKRPGMIIQIPEPGFCIIPLHVSAIGHADMGVDCCILFSGLN